MSAMSVGAPRPWPPPPTAAPVGGGDNKSFRDGCQPGICTNTCRQYCNYFFLQPPPLNQQFPIINNPDDTAADDSSSSRSISPLMAALIAVLAAAFLLLFYYTVISRFCRSRRNRRSRSRLLRSLDPSPSHRVDPVVHDPARPDTGLDESYIRQIAVFKYKRGDGLVESTECAVCLAEFKEEESLRLMPNCEHAFHIPCIDTWLSSHSNCPLCRSTMNPLPARSAAAEGGNVNVSVAALRVERNNDAVVVVREVESRGEVEVVVEVPNDHRLEEREKEIR